MLHKESAIISPKTFLLIQELQAIPDLKEFYLVGGTSLALQPGHRNSIDIDLFTQNDFDSKKMSEFLTERFTVRVDYAFRNTPLANIANIKVDFVKHPHPYLKEPITEEKITFLSKEDIANSNSLIALKALSYFDDINAAVEPLRLVKPLPVKKIKPRISKAVFKTNKVFKSGE